MSTPETNSLPVFYSRTDEAYRGSKIALWAPRESAEDGKKGDSYSGHLGSCKVVLREVPTGARGPFFNVRTADEGDASVQIGVANAFVNTRGFNSLSISLRFDSPQDADAFKAAHEIAEPTKEVTARDGKKVYYVNLYADVSKKHLQSRPQEFKRLGFSTETPAKAG